MTHLATLIVYLRAAGMRIAITTTGEGITLHALTGCAIEASHTGRDCEEAAYGLLALLAADSYREEGIA